MIDQETIGLLLKGVNNVTWQSLFMIGVSFVLMYLAIVKDYEPLLLLPIAAGCMLANLPLSPMIAEDGMLTVLYNMGITNEMFPLLIFVGIGALTDFGPLLENPRLVLLGAAGQFGIFLTLIFALLLGFTPPEAASIGIIGAIDGPTSIYVSGILAPHLLGPITVAAYSYMSLVPIILPPVVKLLTTKKERMIRMPYSSRKISRRTRILFPIVVTVLVGTLVPFATPLIGMQPDEGIRCGRAFDQGFGGGDCQHRDAFSWSGDRFDDGRERVPEARYPVYPDPWPRCLRR